MKKILKITLVMMLSFALVGCGGSTSTKEQEKIVTQFFDHLKKGEMKKINDITTENYEDFLGDTTDAFDSFLDQESYGKTFTKEAQKLIDVVYENLVKEYKMKDIKVDGDKTTITVTGKRIDMDGFDKTEMSSAVTTLMEEYQKEHGEEIQKIYTEKGQDAAIEKMFGDVAEDLFSIFIEKIKEQETIDFTLVFSLVKEKDAWKIDEVNDTTKASTSKDEDEETDAKKDEETDDYDTGKEYAVDKSKLKASATLLQKGRLVDDEYSNKKRIKTDLEFIDYNASNASGEANKYGIMDLSSGTLKLETEVHGNKGSKIIITISDDRNSVAVDEYTLTDTKQVFTKELTGLDVNAKYYSIDIYTADSYDAEYDYGDSVGDYIISSNK